MSVEILPFAECHLTGVTLLCADLGWPSFTDPDLCRRALTAPGVVARVAVEAATTDAADAADAADAPGRVVGFGYAMGDGVLQSYLAQLAVAGSYRRRGIAKLLVKEIFDATGTQRMDLITEDAQAFYRSFGHHERPGFRIYPQYTPPWGSPPPG